MSRFRPLVYACLLLVPLVLAGPAEAASMVVKTRARFIVALETMPEGDPDWSGVRTLARDDAAGFLVVEARDAATVAKAAHGMGVRYVERDLVAMKALGTPDDPRYGDQYALPAMRVDKAWDTTLGSTSVVIAVLDTGVDTSHPDLARFLPGADATGGGSLADPCGHGTHVTGLAAATTGNGQGIAGVAQASVLPVKVLRSSCTGSFSEIARGVTWAADHDADVITLSLGCRGCYSQAIVDAIQYATEQQGVLVVAAAGNEGPCSNCVSFPATLPEVLAVGCTDSQDAPCSFSSAGPEVDVAAPGRSVLSTLPNARYGAMSGTSMSVPNVAGVAALLLSREPDLSPAQLHARLRDTARDAGAPGPDERTGHGIVDAAAALGVERTSGAPPVARFDARADGLDVHVDGSASSDPEGAPMAWSWDWGDGAAAGSGATSSHSYARAGTYTIRLTVTDAEGMTASATRQVSVGLAAPVLTEMFDDGAAQGWTLSGLWRVTGECAGASSGTSSLQYNRAPSCTYDTGARTAGAAIVQVDLAQSAAPRLAFSHRYEVERYTSAAYDRMTVAVSTDGGSSWTVLFQRDSRYPAQTSWAEASLDLSAYRSSATLVRFGFDSMDRYGNAYAGWSVDDVQIG